MSVQYRYETVLCQMITLMQEALYRYLVHEPVDFSKFKQYFGMFLKRMDKVEEEFHESKVKYSKYLTKLSELCMVDRVAKFTPKLNTFSSKKARSLSRKNTTLEVIGEETVNEFDQKKRSGTADGPQSRTKLNYTIDYVGGRPSTGHQRVSKGRYKNELYSENSAMLTGTDGFIPEERKERKPFYEQLARQSQTETIYEEKVKLPKKKRSTSQYRWSVRINKLF